MRLRALDTDVDVRVGGPDPESLARVLEERWVLCLREADAAAEEPVGVSAALVPADGAPAPGPRGAADVVDADVGSLLMRLTHAVTRAVIEARTGDLLMLHASALADHDTGATVVMVARGNTGKSTACRVLGPGRGYLTDETVGIRRDGTVAAYAKPVSTRRPDWGAVKDEVAPPALGLQLPRATPRVAGLLLLARDDGHPGDAVVEELSTLEALTAIAPETSGFMRTDRPLTWLAELIESTGGARRVRYAATPQIAPVVDEVVGPVAVAGRTS